MNYYYFIQLLTVSILYHYYNYKSLYMRSSWRCGTKSGCKRDGLRLDFSRGVQVFFGLISAIQYAMFQNISGLGGIECPNIIP